jgi:hypothetical protein
MLLKLTFWCNMHAVGGGENCKESREIYNPIPTQNLHKDLVGARPLITRITSLSSCM